MNATQEWKEAGLNFRQITPAIGVEVGGADLSKPVGEEQLQAIRKALCEHSLLLFRGQELPPEPHIEFSRRFGPLENHVLKQFCLPEHPEIFIVSNIVENGRHIGAHGGAKLWHSDLSYMEEPSLGSAFYCLECPSEGGETEFASMYAAYDALPEERRRWLDGRRAVHDYNYHYETFLTHRPPLTEEQKAKVPPVSQPCVRTHPETGRQALYLCYALVSHFEGMSPEESRPILKELTEFATQPAFTYRHAWKPGDLVFWDNRSAMHRACPFDEKGSRRLMYRTTIKGDRPFHRPAAAAA
ncbi:TauD/TfdA dioxygenase family protein [Aquibaculum arenosum]|uniref:TauD/TfdA family dioxygenase n=1 Tax=Aquibaculum arenosum TaxID=3032591 RepID=A0ABT5YPI3_9PROT|nr:TauD/TfdA family dioxygenase [Fodinicurvata sp. CAU 1616]MDF2096875.1 TauD/TfdA family dioxygenase [Fodinicurvata sp. CAU 1616]